MKDQKLIRESIEYKHFQIAKPQNPMPEKKNSEYLRGNMGRTRIDRGDIMHPEPRNPPIGNSTGLLCMTSSGPTTRPSASPQPHRSNHANCQPVIRSTSPAPGSSLDAGG